MHDDLNVPLPYFLGGSGIDPAFNTFRRGLRKKGGLAPEGEAGARPVVRAEWIERLACDGVVEEPIVISFAVVVGDLNLRHVTFKDQFSITESDFTGEVDLSFATFENMVCLQGSRFHQPASFRAAQAQNDFRLPLARFSADACFDDLHVREVFGAEGADFRRADFNRARFSKSSLFCGALLADGKSAQTHFRGQAQFNDAQFQGPTYFSGADFHDEAVFDRACMESAAFFNCDKLEVRATPSQVRHERYDAPRNGVAAHARPFLVTTFRRRASFIGARVHSSITFSGAQFVNTADFRRVRIDGTAVFEPYMPDDTGDFVPVRFCRKALFWNAEIGGAAKFEAVQFNGDADFEHVQIGRRAYFNAVMDRKRNRLVTAYFGGQANFLDARINGSVQFDRVTFEGEAIFERMISEGNAYFRAAEPARSKKLISQKGKLIPVKFLSNARFIGANIRGNAEFDGARFYKNAAFERIEVGGNLYLRPWEVETPPVIFSGGAIFIGARIKGDAEFSSAKFIGPADFTGIRVERNIYFDARAHFDEATGLPSNGGQSDCPHPVLFLRAARFTNAEFLSELLFPCTSFKKEADFSGVKCRGAARFEGAEFHSTLCLNEASFASLHFDRPVLEPLGLYTRLREGFRKTFGLLLNLANPDANPAATRVRLRHLRIIRRYFSSDPPRPSQFHCGIAMQGCTYGSIEVRLRDVLGGITSGQTNARRQRNRRQPHTQLARTLRAAGDDRRAEFVYLQQRRTERINTRKRAWADLKRGRLLRAGRGFTNWLTDCFFWLAGNYGVQPERLLIITLCFLITGASVFSFRAAVTSKEFSGARIEANDAGFLTFTPQKPTEEPDLSWREAARFSVSLFIPIIDIPSGSQWRPSKTGGFHPFHIKAVTIPYDMYGSAHRIAGAILVPLIVAAFAAGLYRRLSTDL